MNPRLVEGLNRAFSAQFFDRPMGKEAVMMEGHGTARNLSAGLAGEAQREPQVARSLNRLNSAVDRLQKQIVELESRLAGALRPTPPTPIEPGGMNKAERVHEVKAPLAEMIDGIEHRVDLAGAHVALHLVRESS